MVHLTHSSAHWKIRCIMDSSSEEENTPPNVQRNQAARRNGDSRGSKSAQVEADDASAGTLTPPWLPPGTSKLGLSKLETNPPQSSPPKRRQSRREIAAPYSRPQSPPRQVDRAVAGHEETATALTLSDEVRHLSQASAPGDMFALARWHFALCNCASSTTRSPTCSRPLRTSAGARAQSLAARIPAATPR
ncbi:unnamed protein product [Phytophthora fragariaefolia]|uniref:Unnamed protein product n=1 Tax=Phytophthora fragariaefolia TaxID=1490495 RepID=A0A9W7CN67_9STRA|nr:unnamed protein product [Phytophthora fragariaefolia]